MNRLRYLLMQPSAQGQTPTIRQRSDACAGIWCQRTATPKRGV